MKIDEPKTPYVTDEEFKQLCMEDPDYVKELGVDINSQEADGGVLSDQCMEDELTLAQNNMVINKNISEVNAEGHNSDDEIASPKKNSMKFDTKNY